MRLLFRWVAGALAFYLALYLVDSLIAPRFYVEALWVAVILAVFLGLLNSFVRPLHLFKKKPFYALTVTALTVAVNTLILLIFVWAGAPLSATNVVWVVVAAAFVSLLGGVLNWLIGFKGKERPGTITSTKATRTEKGSRDGRRTSPEAKQPASRGGTVRSRAPHGSPDQPSDAAKPAGELKRGG